MAMKKCASRPDVLYAQSEEWSKDKGGPVWCWTSSDAECPEVPCSVHDASQDMQNIQNMHIEKHIVHILHILHIRTIYIPHNLEECHERQYRFCLLGEEVNYVIDSPHCGIHKGTELSYLAEFSAPRISQTRQHCHA